MNSYNYIKSDSLKAVKDFKLQELKDFTDVHKIVKAKKPSESHIVENKPGKIVFEVVNSTSSEDKANEIRLNEQADEILKKAKEQADAIIEEANKKAVSIFEESFSKGKNEGYNEGIQKAKDEAKAELELKMAEVAKLSDSIIKEQNKFLNDQKNLIIELSSCMTQKVIGIKLSTDENTLFSIFEQAVSEITPVSKLVITVSDKDYPIILRNVGRVKEIAKGFDNIEIRSEESVDRGLLKLETPLAAVDASTDTQIGILKSEIAKTAL